MDPIQQEHWEQMVRRALKEAGGVCEEAFAEGDSSFDVVIQVRSGRPIKVYREISVKKGVRDLTGRVTPVTRAAVSG